MKEYTFEISFHKMEDFEVLADSEYEAWKKIQFFIEDEGWDEYEWVSTDEVGEYRPHERNNNPRIDRSLALYFFTIRLYTILFTSIFADNLDEAILALENTSEFLSKREKYDEYIIEDVYTEEMGWINERI